MLILIVFLIFRIDEDSSEAFVALSTHLSELDTRFK